MIRPSLTTALALTTLACAPRAQDRNEDVPLSIMIQVGQMLPERSNAATALIANNLSPNLIVSQNCTISVTVLWEGAGYQNSLGYFTYTENSDGSITINSSDIIEKNVSFPSAGSFSIGDTYDLKDGADAQRTFVPGEKVGFFVVANGNRSSTEVQNWTYSMAGVPATTPAGNARIGLGLYTSIDKLNREYTSAPEFSRHLAMAWLDGVPGFLTGEDFLLCGFEDLNRTSNSDEDFNDLVFVVHASSAAAIASTPSPRFVPGDPDGDGVTSTNDHFPNDGTRATSNLTPAVGLNVIAFEDNYPEAGDEDYNDAVIAYRYEVVSNAQGLVVDIIGSFYFVARGATYEAGFGVHIPGIPAGTTGTLDIERYLGGGTLTQQLETTMTVEDLITTGQRRIMNIFPSTKTALPPFEEGWASNTLARPESPNGAGARFHLHFTTPVDPRLLGSIPFDPFLYLDRFGDGIWDIHLPGKPGFADRASHLPEEVGATAFMDQSTKRPWALEVPTTWRYPMEYQNISAQYPGFSEWALSSGSRQLSWYLGASASNEALSAPLSEIIPTFAWTLNVPR